MQSLQIVDIEVWNKESETGDFFEDVYLGSCKLTYDQLKIGAGERKERYSLLKDNQVVGSILIARNYRPDEEQDFMETLLLSNKRNAN